MYITYLHPNKEARFSLLYNSMMAFMAGSVDCNGTILIRTDHPPLPSVLFINRNLKRPESFWDLTPYADIVCPLECI